MIEIAPDALLTLQAVADAGSSGILGGVGDALGDLWTVVELLLSGHWT